MPLSRFVLALTKIIHPVAGPNEDTEYGDAANPDVRVEDILPGRTYPMTPEKYLRQAALFHKSSNPKVRRLAQDHENLARVNEVAVYVRGTVGRNVPTRENAEARIKNLRDRAEQIRTDAGKVRQDRIRASMLKIASSYDKVADSLSRFLAKRDYGKTQL